jgi:hypothetical protein
MFNDGGRRPPGIRGNFTMRRLLPFVLAAGLSVAAVAPAAAANQNFGVQHALVGILVQAVATDVVDVNVNDSFNNLLQNALQNADINVLNNLLQNVDIEITDIDVNVLTGVTTITLLGGTIVTIA